MRLEQARFIYYLSTDHLEIDKIEEKFRTTINKAYFEVKPYEAIISVAGKIYSDHTLDKIIDIINVISLNVNMDIKIIALGERGKNREYLLFCPFTKLLTEIVFRELKEIIYEFGGEINDIAPLRLLANEITANIFYKTPVNNNMLDADQFQGLMILDIPLRNKLLDYWVKGELKPKEKRLNDTMSLTSAWKSRLETLSIGIIGSLIASGLVELFTKIVLSTPHGNPSMGTSSIDELGFGKLFKHGSKLSECPVSARSVAVELRTTESRAISILNSISSFQQVNNITRTYKGISERYECLYGCYIFDNSERIVQGTTFSTLLDGLNELDVYCSNNKIIERPPSLGLAIEWIKENKIFASEKLINIIIDKYLSLYRSLELLDSSTKIG